MAKETVLSAAAGNGSAAFTLRKADFGKMIQAARTAAGLYASLQTEVKNAHTEMAVNAGRKMAEELRIRIAQTGREQKGTDVLLKALVNTDYITSTLDGFVVGGAGLDRSPAAAYYRGLEGGSDVFVGRPISGFFFGRGKIRGPSADRTDVKLIQLGRVFGSRPGNLGTSTTALIPVDSLLNKSTGGLRIRGKEGTDGEQGFTAVRVPHGPPGSGGRSTVPTLTRGGGPKDGNSFGHRIVIKNPIPAYEYIQAGGAAWLASGDALVVYAKYLKGTGAIINGVRV